MTAVLKEPTTHPRLSPFPKIADYAFVSNCHTGALVGLDGSVDWLCVPKFDSPSVFGSLLDREAGTFRFGPYGIDHPTTRIYVPGTNVIETTWKTPSGWIIIRDALTMGPHDTDDCVTPHTRPPIDWDASHTLVRTATCIEGDVEVEAVCETAFDYGRTPATWATGERSARGRRQRRRCDDWASVRHQARYRRQSNPWPPRAVQGGHGLLCTVLVGQA